MLFQLHAQESEPAGIFGGAVEVRVVNVEAVVTDKEGERVPGLDVSDFKIFVDGKLVTIDYFSEIRAGSLAVGAEEEEGEAPPPEQALPPALLVEGPEAVVGTNYLVFIDDFFPLRIHRDGVLNSLIADLDMLGPHDRMAVLTFDGKRLEKLSDWTDSKEDLGQVFTAAQEEQTGGYMLRFERQGATIDEVEERRFVSRLKDQTEKVIAAASGAMRTVRNPVGRKVMIVLAGGWAFDPITLLPIGDMKKGHTRHLAGGPAMLKPLTDTANLLGYTLYAADVPGHEGATGSDSGDLGFDFDDETGTTLNDGTGGTITTQTAVDDDFGIGEPTVSPAQRELENHKSLRFLGHETGGKALISGRASEALERSIKDTRSYYWLGFSPKVRGDDAGHEIRVEASRPGLNVRARSGYVDFSRQTLITNRVEGALLFGGSPGDGELDVKVGKIGPAGARKIDVELKIAIPLGGVTAVSCAQGFKVSLHLRVAAVDEWGTASDIPVMPIEFVGKSQPQPGSFSNYIARVILRKVEHDVLVTVHDPVSDLLLAKRVTIDPAAKD